MANNKPKAATKSKVFEEIASRADLSKKQVAGVFDALNDYIQSELGKKGPGLFTIPGLLKIKRVEKPATKARQGINPFTKAPTTFAAKPASKSVRARPIKAIKDAMQ
jgi:nucleoid DNA-binding protein